MCGCGDWLNCAHQVVVQEGVLGKPNLCIQPHMCPRALQTAPCTLCPENSVQIQLEKDESATMVECSDSCKITKRKPRLRFVCFEIFFNSVPVRACAAFNISLTSPHLGCAYQLRSELPSRPFGPSGGCVDPELPTLYCH